MNSEPDKLEVMFTRQRVLQNRLGTLNIVNDKPLNRQLFIDKMLLAAHEELTEISRETLSKSSDMPFGWKQNQSFNEDKYKEEIIDLWHFVMNLWLAIDGTPEEFYKLYLEKNEENHVRQEEGY